MKYIKINVNDIDDVTSLLKSNNIRYEMEENPLIFYVEDRLTDYIENNLIKDNNINVKEASEFISNELNPLDIDIIIQEALMIYESEDEVNGK